MHIDNECRCECGHKTQPKNSLFNSYILYRFTKKLNY